MRGIALVAALVLVGCGHDEVISPIDSGSPEDSEVVDAMPCVPSNGGVEICDGVDNDCNVAIDDLGAGFQLPATCGTCDTDCFVLLLDNDPATVMCVAAQPGVAPGVCSGDCLADHADVDGDGDCEYLCTTIAPDDDTCDGTDDDCDGDIDDEIDLCSDVDHCGACGAACVLDHASAACSHIGVAACDLGTTRCEVETCICTGAGNCWWDRDAVAANGCEYQCDATGVELCGDGIDNDCDGLIDSTDDTSGDPAIGVSCFGSPVGVCGEAAHDGVTACVHGRVECAGPDVRRPYTVAETCNNADDDCNGVTDDFPVDVGTSCGLSATAPCTLGTLRCSAGIPTCVGARDPSVEICDGVDNNCDGTVDGPGTTGVPPTCSCTGGDFSCPGHTAAEVCDGVDNDGNGVVDDDPSDAPSSGNEGCWNLAGNCCTFRNVNWCPPSNGTCNGLGSLTAPCSVGRLTCAGAAGWTCTAPATPTVEQCDGFDNDCDGTPDNGSFLGEGLACGPNGPGDCSQGTVDCTGGGLHCTGTVTLPSAEVCTAGDEDCDGIEGECGVEGASCTIPYDTTDYPGDRVASPCEQGVTYYDPTTDSMTCLATSGVAPSPEICDELDNDCDGTIDEVAGAPDGVAATCPD